MPPDITTGSASGNAKWTVMVFMGVATVDGNAPLLEAAEADFAEMRFVGSGPVEKGFGRPGDELNVFVQVHQGGDIVPRRGRITEGMASGINSLKPVEKGQDDLVGGAALGHFIRTSLIDANHDAENPEHYSLLVLWGHAYDFAIGRAPTTDGMIDALDFTELAHGARAFAAGVPYRCRSSTSSASMRAISRQWRWRVSSSRSRNTSSAHRSAFRCLAGRTDRILDRLRRPFGRLMGAAEFGSYIVRRFCESSGAESGTASLTLLDLNRARRAHGGSGRSRRDAHGSHPRSGCSRSDLRPVQYVADGAGQTVRRCSRSVPRSHAEQRRCDGDRVRARTWQSLDQSSSPGSGQ